MWSRPYLIVSRWLPASFLCVASWPDLRKKKKKKSRESRSGPTNPLAPFSGSELRNQLMRSKKPGRILPNETGRFILDLLDNGDRHSMLWHGKWALLVPCFSLTHCTLHSFPSLLRFSPLFHGWKKSFPTAWTWSVRFVDVSRTISVPLTIAQNTEKKQGVNRRPWLLSRTCLCPDGLFVTLCGPSRTTAWPHK